MAMKLKDLPDHHDAELVLKLYELRTEPIMRESRGVLNKDFWPTSFADIQPWLQSSHPGNAAWRQVTSYWEMAYGMVKHGVLHGDFMLESNAEGFFVFARVKPYLAELRASSSSRSFFNAEWVSQHSEFARETLARYEKVVAARLAARAKG